MRPKISFEEHKNWLSSSGLLQNVNSNFEELKGKIKDCVFGPSSDFFVGSKNYPEIIWGPQVALIEVPETRNLYGADYETIIKARTALVHGRRYSGIKPTGQFIEKSREIAMSSKPIDVEIKFTKIPNIEMNFSLITPPMGAGAPMKDIKIAGNPKIPNKVDDVVNDKLLANDAIKELVERGFDSYYLINLLSAGILGRENKKLVPTRWSITATDDIIAKNLMEKIRENSELKEIMVFSNEYLFNHFNVILIPGKWEFENFEAWAPSTSSGFSTSEFTITEEYEPFWGRSSYAKKQLGGYYASRLGVCEYLYSIGKQARVIVIREIGKEYQIPVGVWEVRENVRHAFKNNSKKFSTLNEALGYLKTILCVQISEYLKQTKIITQRRLTDFS